MAYRIIHYRVFYATLLIFILGTLGASVKTSEDPINENLNPSVDDCGAAISRTHPRKGTINQALACMKNGFRSVYLGSDYENTVEFIAPELRDFYATVNKLTVGTHCILYTHTGTRNALLLRKYFLERDLPFVANNPYLLGILLGYAEDDILFFYQRWAYLEFYHLYHEKWIFDPLHKWPQDKQNAFQVFVKENKQLKMEYSKDKAMAERWLKAHEHYSIKELSNFGSFSSSVRSAIAKVVDYFLSLFYST